MLSNAERYCNREIKLLKLKANYNDGESYYESEHIVIVR